MRHIERPDTFATAAAPNFFIINIACEVGGKIL